MKTILYSIKKNKESLKHILLLIKFENLYEKKPNL